jgi:hypothetical protein
MKKSLLAICLMFTVNQAHSADRVVIDIFMPLTVCIPKLTPVLSLKKCEI